MALKKAYLKDAAFLASVRNSRPSTDQFHLWWLGQSGFLILFNGSFLLVDPYLSDSLTKKYAHTDKPHIRISECVINPSELSFIDLVTSSHNHTDHLDGETLKPILSGNPNCHLLIPEANRDFVAARLGCAIDFPSGICQGEQLSFEPFKVHAIPAAHNDISKDAAGRCQYLGYVFQFAGWTIYHSGDTLWYEQLEEWLKPFHIDVAILPINGHKPERRVAGNLDAREAAELAKKIEARMVIPCHYDMFTFNTADPQDFIDHCLHIGQPYCVLGQGEGWSSTKLPS